MRLLLKLSEEKHPGRDVFDVLKQFDFQLGIGRLRAGETTELLEAKKIQKDDVEIIERLIAIAAKLRK